MELFHLIILILHVFGAAILIGGLFALFISVLRPDFSIRELGVMARIGKTNAIVGGIQLLTGIALISTEWEEVGHNPLVWTKLIIFVAVSILTGGLLRKRAMALMGQPTIDPNEVKKLRAIVAIALLLLLTVAALGVVIVESA